ncbi:helix-turn-helix transcriptional regulator [Olivibacter sitiensis]|uniref:helix-turn-helix transcriptional regulator n=1 Tax=Olivibacter sitiensis TaxID=376470 RepID=UPI00042320B7|nr:response regulator transcription factor [Olivibacter sitiensis]
MTNAIQTHEPSDKLKPFVLCYYFIKSEDPNFRSVHYSFPNTFTALTLYKDSEFVFAENYFLAKQSMVGKGGAIVQIRKQAPLLVDIMGKVDRVTILFKDFGLNQFIPFSMEQVMSEQNGFFDHWNQDDQFQQYKDRLFSLEAHKERIALLEEFLWCRLVPREYPLMRKAVAMLQDFDRDWKMEEIAQELHLSLRSFNRLFKQAIGNTPITYRRIAQFRYSLKRQSFQDQFQRLTDIGYQSHFYDQSYFNKVYKKLTGSNPKSFFQSIDRMGNDRLIFQYVKK